MSERISLVEKSVNEMSIRKQCSLLAVNRSSLYIKPKGESMLNLTLMKLIDKAHSQDPSMGVMRMLQSLIDAGYEVNVKRVRRLMRLMCIESFYPKRNLSKLGKAEYIKPYLLRYLEITYPNQVWAIDITYIPMKKGFMYLTAVIDVYSRYIVGWSLSNSLEAEGQAKLIDELVAIHGKPEIINSDQGSQYTSKVWTECLGFHQINISMDGKGRATDNAFIERFFRTIKWEHIYLHPQEQVIDLYHGIQQYIQHYNHNRTHSAINNHKPFEIYSQLKTLINKKEKSSKKEKIL